MKKCASCKAIKEFSEFGKCSQKKSGLKSYCKECCRSKYSEYRKAPKAIENVNKRARKFRRTEKGIKYLTSYKKSISRKISDAVYYHKTYNEPEYHIKHLARAAINNAIKSGKIQKQPCEKCGSVDNIHAHHSDYSKPLDVNFLCRKHHLEIHGLLYG